MPSDPALRPAAILKGALLMCVGAGLMFPALNTCTKLLSAGYPVVEIVWARFAGHLAVTLLLFLPARGPRLLVARRPGLQVLRSFLLLAATALFITAIGRIQLATAAAINFTVPLIVTALSLPLLGEPVGWRRTVAVLVGFAGVLLILRPGAGMIEPALLLLCGQALCYALYQIVTRRGGAYDNAETSIVYAAFVGTAATSLVVPFAFRMPDNLLDVGLLAATGILGGIGHYFLTRAFQLAPAALLSPLGYAELLGASFFGWLVFANVPDAFTWLGAAVIVGSGLYIAGRRGK